MLAHREDDAIVGFEPNEVTCISWSARAIGNAGDVMGLQIEDSDDIAYGFAMDGDDVAAVGRKISARRTLDPAGKRSTGARTGALAAAGGGGVDCAVAPHA